MHILCTCNIVYRCYNDHHGICETFKRYNDIMKDLEEFLKEENLDRSSGLRKLLIEAIEEWKKRRALEKLAGSEVSFSKAAEMADMDVWSFAAWLRRGASPGLKKASEKTLRRFDACIRFISSDIPCKGRKAGAY